MSCAYIVAVETGKEPISLSLAQSVGSATGVDPEWLLAKYGESGTPVMPLGAVLTREYFVGRFQGRHGLLSDIDPDGDTSVAIHACCYALTKLLLAAYRRRRFDLALRSVRKAVENMRVRFELGVSEEETALDSLEAFLFRPAGLAERHGHEFHIGILSGLLSPLASLKWAKALEGPAIERNQLVRDLGRLQKLVLTSFRERPPKTIAKTGGGYVRPS